jgi:U4/U6 small nuclear ribonucleoprotein PRP31
LLLLLLVCVFAFTRPDLTIKKRRGGKRVRRMKERYEETAIMKQANTRAFSSATGEYGDDAMGITRGLLDSAEVVGGPLRRNLEKKQVRVANTKASRKRAAQLASAGAPAASSTSGLATSIVFTPSQGMELINPDAQRERVKDANQRWFGDQAGFRSALPKR